MDWNEPEYSAAIVNDADCRVTKCCVIIITLWGDTGIKCVSDYISQKLSHKQRSGNSQSLHEYPSKADR